MGNYFTKNHEEKENNIHQDNASSASYSQNKANFDNDINKKISNLSKNALNPENEIVKNYGSFNSIPEINKITNQMAFNKANLNTNENFYSSKKSNDKDKISNKKNYLKNEFTSNQIESSDSSYLSSLDSNLNYYNKEKKGKTDADAIDKRHLLTKTNNEKDFEGIQ